jgi:hypothetical protein
MVLFHAANFNRTVGRLVGRLVGWLVRTINVFFSMYAIERC